MSNQPAITPLPRRGSQESLLDLAERAVLLLLFLWFLSRVLPSVHEQPYNMLILASESLTAVLVLIRRPGPMATSLYAWLIAIAGTCAPLFVLPSHAAPLIPVEAAAIMMTLGLFISIGAKAFLRRSFGVVPASRGVRRGGPYRYVRHPMYSGYVVTQAGFLMLNPSLWNIAVYGAAWFAMILRIMEEEKILSGDGAYRAYQADVRWRLIPGIY